MNNNPCSETTKKKISKKMRGRKITWADKISKALKGKQKSEEHRKNLSKVAKKRYENGYGKKLIAMHKGLKLSDEWKKNIGKGVKGKMAGKNHPNYKGGITSENQKIKNSIEYRLWRESVYARDNWVCRKCLERGGELRAHHIKNFAQVTELRFAIDNGITFCKKCHIKFHKKYGRKDNTNEQVEEYTTFEF